MYSSNLRVLILDQEFNRIQEYVSRVPHRATGGLLLGNRFTRSGTDWLIVTRTTVGVPDERLADESCINHPVYTSQDAARSIDGPPDSRFLGRWHAHPDGLNRPSSADLDWAMDLLQDPDVPLEEILHPIAVSSADDVKLFPYLVNREGLTFQKVNWQVASGVEIDQVRRNETPASPPEKPFDPQIFSLEKTRDLLRGEREAVAGLADVARCEVFEQGAVAVLEAEVPMGDDRMVLQIAAGTLYPVHAPTLRVSVNGETRSFSSKVLREWNSSHRLKDVVEEVITRLKPPEPEDAVPLPRVDETEPRKREAALLKAAGYSVQMTVTGSGGALLVATSPVLEHDRKRFYAIMPAAYPEEPPLVALAPSTVPVNAVEFEALPETAAGFTLLTMLERLHPAARAQRAQSQRHHGGGVPATALFLYFCLFLAALTAGYAWQSGMIHDLKDTVHRFAASLHPSAPTHGDVVAPPENAAPVSPHMNLTAGRRVLVVVLDAGRGTNLSADQAKWAVETALRPAPVDVVKVDLEDLGGDLKRIRDAARDIQAILIFSYGAGPRQAGLVDTLKKTPVPIGIISMAPGPDEGLLKTAVNFYREVDRPGGQDGAQRTLLDLKKDKTIEVH